MCYNIIGFKSVRQLQYIFILLFGVLLSWQCMDPPAEPLLPTWDTDVSLPLANREYLLKELVERNPDLLGLDENGVILYSFSDTVENEPFGDLLRLTPEPTDFSFEVGAFTLRPDDIDFDVSVGGYLGLPAGHKGPSPGVDPVVITGALPEVQSMRYMILDTGEVHLTMTNESGVPVELQDGLRIRNSDDGSLVVHFIYNEVIEAGETVTVVEQLGETRVYRNMEYDFQFSSPPNENVEIPDDPQLACTLSFDVLEVREADAQIPSQALAGEFNGEIVLDDSIYMTELLFSHGVLDFVIENTVDLDIPVTVTIPDLLSRDDPSQAYRFSETLTRGSIASFSIDASQWMIRTSSLSNSLSYSIKLGSVSSTDEFIEFRATDSMDGTISPQDSPDDEFVIEYIEGVITPTSYEISERVELDLGEITDYFEGDITFGNVRFNLGLFFDGGFDALANLYIVGENKHGVRDSVAIPHDQRFISGHDWSIIVLNESNSNIVDFFSAFVPNFPEELHITGDLLVNPNYEPGYLDVASELQSSIHLDVPLDIGIRDGVVTDTLAIGTDDDDDFDRDIFDYVNHGRLYFETDNGIPAGMDLRMQVINSEGEVLRAFPVEESPAIAIKAAPVDESGFVNGTSGKDVRILDLTEEDIQILRNADKAELFLGIYTNDGRETVKFCSRGSVQVKIYATFNMRADFN